MQATRLSLILAVALISWPVFAQAPPAAVKEADANVANKPVAFSGVPLPEPPAGSIPDTAAKQEGELTQSKNEAPTGPILSSLPPLSEIREPGDLAVTFGGWFTQNSGSTVKTGEYQGTSSSPFFVVDGLFSNGAQTLGVYGNMTDDDSNQANVHFFTGKFFADFDYQRFIHNLGHESLNNFTPDTPFTASKAVPSDSVVLGQDLSRNTDYAIHVEEIKGSVGDRINDNLRVRVDVSELHKFGDRQENAAAHCFEAQAGGQKVCHLVSQSQYIDWTTVEVTPRVEATFGPVSLEYSRLMRQFTQDDSTVSRDYTYGSGLSGAPTAGILNGGPYAYGVVPDSLTQIDQLKLSLDLGPKRSLYAFGYIGNTQNEDRDTNRSFNGYDLRLTDWSIPRTSVTIYAKAYNQTGESPATFLADETKTSPTGMSQPLPAAGDQNPADYIPLPLEYHRYTEGIKGSWRPDINIPLFKDLAFTAGYEYDYLDRINAVWETPPQGPLAGTTDPGANGPIISQGNTTTQTLFVGVSKPWCYNIESYVRYKILYVDNPLFGVRQENGVVDTSQPQHQDIVEFGGGWHPCSNFSITLQQDIDVDQTHYDHSSAVPGNIVNFNAQTYNTTLTMWYAPIPKLSMIASASLFSNWIDQNLFLGDATLTSTTTSSNPLILQPTYYAGVSELFNFNLYYLLTDKSRFNFGYQYVRGSNTFNMMASPSFYSTTGQVPPPFANSTYGDLAQFSSAIVDTTKITAGISWRVRPKMTVSFHYDFFDYVDEVVNANSGIAHQFNANFSYVW